LLPKKAVTAQYVQLNGHPRVACRVKNDE
jgi:hypothetical protein